MPVRVPRTKHNFLVSAGPTIVAFARARALSAGIPIFTFDEAGHSEAEYQSVDPNQRQPQPSPKIRKK